MNKKYSEYFRLYKLPYFEKKQANLCMSSAISVFLKKIKQSFNTFSENASVEVECTSTVYDGSIR